MSQTEIGAIVVDLGWTRHREVDAWYSLELGDRTAAIAPFVRNMRGSLMIDLGEICYSSEMMASVDYVFGSRTDWGWLAKRRPPTRSTVLTLDRGSVLPLLDGAITWAQSVDRESSLESLAAIRGEVDPGAAIQHLAALGLLGRKSQLEDYLERVRMDDYHGLSHAISPDMVERALELPLAG